MMSRTEALERINYAHDERNCEPDSAPVLILEDGTEFKLPTKWVVCPVCNGAGSHVDPAIDAGGLSAEDFAEDPDFAEDYLAGTYDVPCNKCGGRTTVREVYIDRLSPEHRALYEQQLLEDAAYESTRRMEYMLGA